MSEYNYLFVSDFHVAMGKTEARRPAYHPREDFFYDEAFFRFLRWADKHQKGKKWELIFNGDCFDFWPVDAFIMREFSEWDEIDWNTVDDWEKEFQDYPALVQAETGDDQQSVVAGGTAVKHIAKQIQYQLDPNLAWHENYDNRRKANAERGLSVKKLYYIKKGHPHLFEALGWWIASDHKLVMMRGNHDLEIFWDDVQKTFKEYVYEYYLTAMSQMEKEPLDFNKFAPQIDFSYPWFYYQPGVFYAEHGSQYEPANSAPNFLNPVHPDDPNMLNPPIGSLIVHYLLSPLEDKIPELENRGSYIQFIFKLVIDQPEKVVRTLWGSLVSFYRAARILWKETKHADSKPTDAELETYAKHTQLPVEIVKALYDTGEKPLLAYQRLTAFLI